MGKNREAAASPALRQLQQELQQMNLALRNAYDKFDYVTDPQLVEASIYEIESLKARCGYLLRCIKEQLEAQCVSAADESACLAAVSAKGGPVCPS